MKQRYKWMDDGEHRIRNVVPGRKRKADNNSRRRRKLGNKLGNRSLFFCWRSIINRPPCRVVGGLWSWLPRAAAAAAAAAAEPWTPLPPLPHPFCLVLFFFWLGDENRGRPIAAHHRPVAGKRRHRWNATWTMIHLVPGGYRVDFFYIYLVLPCSRRALPSFTEFWVDFVRVFHRFTGFLWNAFEYLAWILLDLALPSFAVFQKGVT